MIIVTSLVQSREARNLRVLIGIATGEISMAKALFTIYLNISGYLPTVNAKISPGPLIYCDDSI